jgi:hypothetical protein
MTDKLQARRTISGALFGIAALSLFASFLVMQSASEEDQTAKATLTWNKIPATILSSQLVKIPGLTVGPDTRHMYRVESPPTFAPSISYEVHDGTNSFISEGISYPPPSFAKEADATEFLQRFKMGAEVTAYQNPKELHETVLIAGFHAMVKNIDRLATIGFLAVLLLAALAFAIFPDKRAAFQTLLKPKI